MSQKSCTPSILTAVVAWLVFVAALGMYLALAGEPVGKAIGVMAR